MFICQNNSYYTLYTIDYILLQLRWLSLNLLHLYLYSPSLKNPEVVTFVKLGPTPSQPLKKDKKIVFLYWKVTQRENRGLRLSNPDCIVLTSKRSPSGSRPGRYGLISPLSLSSVYKHQGYREIMVMPASINMLIPHEEQYWLPKNGVRYVVWFRGILESASAYIESPMRWLRSG